MQYEKLVSRKKLCRERYLQLRAYCFFNKQYIQSV